MRVQVLYKVLENPTQASRRSLHVQHLVNTKANHKATLCFFARLDAVTNRLQDAYLHLWNWTVYPHVLTKLFLMLLLFNSLPPSLPHTFKSNLHSQCHHPGPPGPCCEC